MADATIDDDDRANALVERLDAGFHFRDHAAGNGAIGEQRTGFCDGELRDEGALLVQHTGNVAPSGPTADLFIDAQGFAHCVLSDPDGVSDLDLTTLSLSLDLQVLDFSQIRRAFELGSATATSIDLVSMQPIAGWTVENVLAVSVRDLTGQFSGDQLTLHP